MTITEPTRTQQLIARRMAESQATIPTFTLRATVDMSAVRRAARDAEGERRAQTRPVLQRPRRQGVRDRAARAPERERRLPRREVRALRAGEHRRRRRRARARSSSRRSSTPTARASAQIAAETRALAERVRAGADHAARALRRHVHGLATSACSACARFEAVINPPQAAILAVGALEPRPVVRDGAVVVRAADGRRARLRPPHPLRRRRPPSSSRASAASSRRRSRSRSSGAGARRRPAGRGRGARSGSRRACRRRRSSPSGA